MRTVTKIPDRHARRQPPGTVMFWGWIAALLLTGTCPVQAAATVEVLETYPAGPEVTLGRNENFYLRLRYDTDHSIGIWARPYFKGEPANAGSNGSYSYSGNGEALGKVVDGRVFTGRQALELKLVDMIGNEQTAREWLAKEKNIDLKTPVRDYPLSPRFSDLPFPFVGVARVLEAVGMTEMAQRLNQWGTVQAIERLNLDGLLALWHPPVSN